MATAELNLLELVKVVYDKRVEEQFSNSGLSEKDIAGRVQLLAHWMNITISTDEKSGVKLNFLDANFKEDFEKLPKEKQIKEYTSLYSIYVLYYDAK